MSKARLFRHPMKRFAPAYHCLGDWARSAMEQYVN